jgi:hypothetical protein
VKWDSIKLSTLAAVCLAALCACATKSWAAVLVPVSQTRYVQASALWSGQDAQSGTAMEAAPDFGFFGQSVNCFDVNSDSTALCAAGAAQESTIASAGIAAALAQTVSGNGAPVAYSTSYLSVTFEVAEPWNCDLVAEFSTQEQRLGGYVKLSDANGILAQVLPAWGAAPGHYEYAAPLPAGRYTLSAVLTGNASDGWMDLALTVPEPASAALLLIPAILIRRRKR